LDFRVKAIIGHDGSSTGSAHSWIPEYGYDGVFSDVASSGWSDDLTVAVPDDVALTPSPTQTATLPPSSPTSDDNNQQCHELKKIMVVDCGLVCSSS